MNATKLKELMINDEGFAFDPRSGNTYSINATGLLVVNGVKAGLSRDRLVEQLCDRFDVEVRTADRDLEAFLKELQRQKLVEAEEVS